MGQEWVTFIQGVGFPAAVAFFVLWRIEKAVNALTVAVVELKLALYRDPGLRPPWPSPPRHPPHEAPHAGP